MKPIRTVGLLHVLRRAGFDDDAFHIVHHFGQSETMASHLRYCLAHESFQSGGNNEIVERRLEYVLDSFLNLGESAAPPAVFAALAQKAATAITN